MAEAWKQYCEKLYLAEKKSDRNDGMEQEIQPSEYEEELEILLQEVESAILYLKNNKASGPDGITAEFLKASGEKMAKVMHEIFKDV